MKKIAFALSLLLTIFVSCSSDDSSVPIIPISESEVLLRKAIDVDADGSISTVYNYSGKKIVNAVSSDGSTIEFTYTGNLITKMEYFTGMTLDQKDTFTYDSNGRLITFVRLTYADDWGDKTVYTHNSDGSILFTDYNGDIISQTLEDTSGKIIFTDGEVSKVQYYAFGTTIVNNEVDMTYDNKNNPFKNVIGFDKIAFNEGDSGGGVSKNVISEISTVSSFSNVNYSYTYNELNFPKTVVMIDNSGTVNSQLFY